MTSAHSAAPRHLRVVGDTEPGDTEQGDTEPGGGAPGRPIQHGRPGQDLQGGAGPYGAPGTPGEETPLVGYVVLLPEGADPTELFTADGTRARFRPLPPSEKPAAPHFEAAPAAGRSGRERSADAGGLHVDTERHTAQADGRELSLTYLEFELLAHLVANPHRVHTRSHLVATLWGYSHIGDGRTVDVHVARLRRKLGRFREAIVTVRRVGYKYEPGRAR